MSSEHSSTRGFEAAEPSFLVLNPVCEKEGTQLASFDLLTGACSSEAKIKGHVPPRAQRSVKRGRRVARLHLSGGVGMEQAEQASLWRVRAFFWVDGCMNCLWMTGIFFCAVLLVMTKHRMSI